MCFGKRKKNSSVEFEEAKVHKAHEPKILIIGAGAAGLACGTKLLEFGFKDVTIYEAENRIGGRIHTVPFADNVIDMGAQWCHGEEGNVVYEMVKDLKYLDFSEDCYYKSDFLRSDGLSMDEERVERLKAIMADIFENRHKHMPSYEGSYGAYLQEKFLDAFDDSINDDIDELEAMDFFVNFLKIEGAETGANVNDVSAKGFLSYWECPGNYMLNWKKTGWATFLRYLLKDEKDDSFGIMKGRIHLNKCVSNICWVRDDNLIEITCSDNDDVLVVDHVIVTVSLGVLKNKHTEMFDPVLPDNKVEAINALGYGTVLKIFLEFTESFWPPDWCGFNALWTLFDLEALKNLPRQWISEIFGFYRVSYQPRMLIGWLGGSQIEEVEKMKITHIQKDVIYMLRKFLPKFDIPIPKSIVVTKWATNNNFMGTYSYQSMILAENGQYNPILAQPVSILQYAPSNRMADRHKLSTEYPLIIKPVVLFAGEATSTHYFSTVHGAVESGWREANRLAGFYQKQ